MRGDGEHPGCWDGIEGLLRLSVHYIGFGGCFGREVTSWVTYKVAGEVENVGSHVDGSIQDVWN